MSTMLSVRVADEAAAAITAGLDGRTTASWLRQAIEEKLAREGQCEVAVSTLRARQLSGEVLPVTTVLRPRRTTLAGNCVHPSTARRRLPYYDLCGVCGRRVP